jgi:hypothetical protein
MLINKVKLSRHQPFELLPVSGVLLSVLFAEAEEQVARISLVSSLPKVLVGNTAPLWKRFVRLSIHAISPLALVTNCFRREIHMPGLRGLFVWKPKATTDALGTQFKRNTKPQAKKNHLAGWFLQLHS